MILHEIGQIRLLLSHGLSAALVLVLVIIFSLLALALLGLGRRLLLGSSLSITILMLLLPCLLIYCPVNGYSPPINNLAVQALQSLLGILAAPKRDEAEALQLALLLRQIGEPDLAVALEQRRELLVLLDAPRQVADDQLGRLLGLGERLFALALALGDLVVDLDAVLRGDLGGIAVACLGEI
ncbi:hypothetical protein VTK56DRAFT_6032 [Thermocarpiscus australiensis]